MTEFVSVRVEGAARTIEALSSVNQHAQWAQQTAVRAAATRGRNLIAKEFKQYLPGVGVRKINRRLKFFIVRKAIGSLADAKIWYGLKVAFGATDSTQLAALLQEQGAFRLPGKKPLFFRVEKPKRVGPGARGNPPWNNAAQKARGALPVRKAELRVPAEKAREIMTRIAKLVMRTRYVEVITKDFNRRVQRAARRAIGRAEKRTGKRLERALKKAIA